MKTVSSRSDVEPFLAMDVLAEANRMIARGEPVISLAVGQPAAPAPAMARDAARAMLDHGRIAYTDAPGRADLRERLARHYRETYGVNVPASRIMITTGSSAGFNLAFLSAFDPGDRVALAAPGYPAYRNVLRMLGLVPVEIAVSHETDYVLGAEQLREEHARRPLAGVLVASPANPTGTVTPAAEIERLVRFCDEEGIRFISDEIYHGLVYREPQATALAYGDRAIVINSFSKYYCMTGWRIGWMVLPEELVRPSERIAQSLYISAPELSQFAAMAALDASAELDLVRDGYRANRDLLADRLPRLGFRDLAPIDGAFYAYADCSPMAEDSSAFAKRMLEECKVAATPGLDFDRERGLRHIRFSYACGQDELLEALGRLEDWLPSL